MLRRSPWLGGLKGAREESVRADRRLLKAIDNGDLE